MSSEYRTNARECERMAENSLNPDDKAAWIQMARYWVRMIPTSDSNPLRVSERPIPESRWSGRGISKARGASG
jgi:hypothetical protein